MLVEALDLWSLATEGTQELNGMESAAVDVEVDIPTVEIRGAGFPHLYLRMHRLYGFPDGLTNTFALDTHLHIEECKLTYGLPLSRLGRADASIALLSLLHRFTQSAISGNLKPCSKASCISSLKAMVCSSESLTS